MIVASIIKIILFVIFWGPFRSGDLKTRWFLTFIALSLFYDAAYFAENNLLPFLHHYWDKPDIDGGLTQLISLLNYLLQTVLPYGLIMFSSAYSIMLTGILMFLFSNYFARAFFPAYDGKLFIPYIVGFMFIIFVVSLIGYGTLGIRFRLERQRIDHSMRSIATGTDMINHVMKPL